MVVLLLAITAIYYHTASSPSMLKAAAFSKWVGYTQCIRTHIHGYWVELNFFPHNQFVYIVSVPLIIAISAHAFYQSLSSVWITKL